ncbi:hypothetical protein DSM112329_03498 [Paraconexibacter sp. AEG42_29]|uniref:Zinc ribbon domain-containing protein n=1 Tax=Paraconexibacter sp. AEG42_29 TaxID=2997339 RepID=A0AAU7AY37_9ACTN
MSGAVSTPPADTTAAPSPPDGSISCPRCQSVVIRGQDWCLVCGAPARTRLAAAPNWRLPVAAVGGLLTAAVVVIVVAFFAITSGDDEPTGTVSRTAVTTPAPTPAAPGQTVTPGATTPPGATATDPGTPPAAVDPSTPPATGTTETGGVPAPAAPTTGTTPAAPAAP